MSSMKICINCGCSDIVSDRSLGGKLVCVRCGSSIFRNKSLTLKKVKNLIYLIIGLFILFIIII